MSAKPFTLNNSKKKEIATFSADTNTFIWSFRDLIASTDHVKGKSLEVLAVKVGAEVGPEVGAFVRRYSLTPVVAKV